MKLLPPSSSAITKISKPSTAITAEKISSISIQKKTEKVKRSRGYGENLLLSIQKKVIKIDKLLKNSIALQKKETEKKKKENEFKEFDEKEKELESKKSSRVKGIKLPSLPKPKLGIFDWIKNFIFNTILGFVLVRMVDYLPTLLKILPLMMKAADFIIDVGGKLLDGLVTFIDWGYKAYDATRGFVKNLFGESGVKKFDELSSTLNKFLNLAIIAGMLAAGSGGFGGRGGRGGLSGRPRPGMGGRPRVTTTGGRGLGRPDIRNPLRERPSVTTSGGGRDGRFDIRNPLRQKPRITGAVDGAEEGLLSGGRRLLTRGGEKGILSSVRPFLKRLPVPVIGALIDFGLSVALGESPGRAAFRAIGAALLGAVGAAVGSVVPIAGNLIGGIVGGMAGDYAGAALYDLFFNGKKPSQGRTVNLAEGGSPVEDQRVVVGKTPITRTLKKKKPKRTINVSPIKIKPGRNTGGSDKIQSVFPNPEKPPEKAWWDPLGVFTGKPNQKGQEQQKTEKPKEKVANPQEFLVKSNDTLGRADFFGPFFTLALKSVIGDRPGKIDYLRTAQGLNSWIQTTFKSGQLGFAGGGEVDTRQFFQGEDYTNTIAKSVEESVSKEVDTTIRDLAKELSLKPAVGREEKIQENIKKGQEGGAGGEGGELDLGSTEYGEGPLLKIARREGISGKELAAFLAQMAHESGDFKYRREISGGSRSYGGGGPWTGPDGKTYPAKYHGRGYIQLTHDYNYKKYGDKLGVNLLANPELAMQGDIAAKIAILYWKENVRPVVKGNWDNVFLHSKAINYPAATKPSQVNGMADRQAKYDKYLRQLVSGELAKKTESAMRSYPSKTSESAGTIGGSGKFIQGNSGRSKGVHFHIGPGSQTKGTILQPQYNADARATASKVVDYFLKKGSSVYDGRRGTYYKSGKEVGAAQRAHTASGSQGGIDLQVDFENPVPFPLKVMGMAYRPNGFGVSADIVGSNSFVAHGRYDEKGKKAPQELITLYEKGGETLDGPHEALIGEKGTEYVIDADSYRTIKKEAPALLDILNYDVKDKASLQKNIPAIIASLSKYTDYEEPYPEPEIQYIEVPVEIPIPIPSSSGGPVSFSVGSRGIHNKDYEVLEML